MSLSCEKRFSSWDISDSTLQPSFHPFGSCISYADSKIEWKEPLLNINVCTLYIERNRYGKCERREILRTNCKFHWKIVLLYYYYWRDKNWFLFLVFFFCFSFHSSLVSQKSTFCHIQIEYEESLHVFSVHQWFYHFIVIRHLAIARNGTNNKIAFSIISRPAELTIQPKGEKKKQRQ